MKNYFLKKIQFFLDKHPKSVVYLIMLIGKVSISRLKNSGRVAQVAKSDSLTSCRSQVQVLSRLPTVTA